MKTREACRRAGAPLLAIALETEGGAVRLMDSPTSSLAQEDLPARLAAIAAASLLSALRAARLDPPRALRTE